MIVIRRLAPSFLALILLCSTAHCSPRVWQIAQGPLTTRWASEVDPENTLPEYPRPQLVRERWLNLNGLWDYCIASETSASNPEAWQGKILVPFAVESALSGVMKPVGDEQKLWYRRTFDLPKDWQGDRLLLHFGAVDWQTIVYVNGKQVGTHRGGYDAFSFDITEALNASGQQEVVVEVWDPSDAGSQPRGKQVRRPEGIFYTPITGIWQTVWLEPVAATRLEALKITPQFDNSSVRFDTRLQAGQGDVVLKVEVFDGKNQVAKATFEQSSNDFPSNVMLEPSLTVEIPNAKPWCPDSPHLYDVRIVLLVDGKQVDSVGSYFGMRKIAVANDEIGIPMLMLNNEPVFQYGPLDQGYWPDGLYTAPTDEALRFDIEITKQMGFNMTRKHVKVEPARWYYWCDKLGLLVWQDMPSGDRSIGPQDPDIIRTEESADQFEAELHAMIAGLYNAPSIVIWVPFNEGWGQYDTKRIVDLVEEWDPTRLVNNASGWVDRGVGDVHDIHHYPAPAAPQVEAHRSAVLGEFGGLGLPIAEHTWQKEKNWGYQSYRNQDELETAYRDLIWQLRDLIGQHGLAAAVYTQLTDVEIEVNGLLSYDRRVQKIDSQALRSLHQQIYRRDGTNMLGWATLVPAADERPAKWKYTLDVPQGDWTGTHFAAKGWKEGEGGFGDLNPPGGRVSTTWSTPEIWIRRDIELPAELPEEIKLWINHDEVAEVYLNGVLACELTGWSAGYRAASISSAARKTIKPGRNVLAVHCKQSTGAQYIDVGLVAGTHLEEDTQRWSRKRAWAWYKEQDWICGFNYVPGNAISYTEMWMPEVFDAKLIDQELKLSDPIGFNTARVVLSYVVWEKDPEGFKQRFEQFLAVCHKHNIRVMPCFFDDCVFGSIVDPEYGPQPDVVEGWYANGWTPSPGHRRAQDQELWDSFEAYVKDIVYAHRNDERILCWDLYNEAGNSGMDARTLPLLRDTFRWAREIEPSQPLTSGLFGGNARIAWFLKTHSDIISFHNYDTPSELQSQIQQLQRLGRPLICSEWLNRPRQSTVAECLPIFSKYRVGAVHWGLVNGRTQTHLPWGHQPGDPPPTTWQHDLFHSDFTPYSAAEIDIFSEVILGAKSVDGAVSTSAGKP